MADSPTPETPDTGNSSVGEVGVDPKWHLPFSPNGLPDEFLYGQPVNEYSGEGYYDHSRPGGESTHPFKVDMYSDPKDNKRKIRVRLGRFFFVANTVKPSAPVTSSSGNDYFTLDGDDGVPSISDNNMSSQNHVAAEFLSSDTPGYAFLDSPATDESAHVYLRYILKWDPSGGQMTLASETNRLNIVAVANSDVSTGARIYPISALTSQDPEEGGDAEDRKLMRENPSPLVPSSANGLTLSTSTYFYGMYYLKLATLSAPNTASGLIIDQFIHDDIIYSVTNVGANGSKSGYGAA